MISTQRGPVEPVPLHKSIPARPDAQLVPPAVAKYVLDKWVKYKPIDEHQVPKAVSSNKLWREVSSLPKSVYVLCSTRDILVLVVVLHERGLQMVFKAWPSRISPGSPSQVAAELTASKKFPWTPIMPTMAVFCEGEGEGKQKGWCCSVTTYAGHSIQSLIGSRRWYKTISAQDRMEFAKLLIVQSLMAFEVMQQTGPGYYHRDVKPDNLCVDPTTGWLVSVIDYGLMIPSDLPAEDFCPGFTDGYYTPELVNPKGRFRAFQKGDLADSTVNATTDVFLTSFTALEVAVGLSGLPWVLQPGYYDTRTSSGLQRLVCQHARAAAAGYDALINRVSCPAARDFFRWTMCTDHTRRPTPAQALQHPWLAECRAAVQEALARESPLYDFDNQLVVDLFSGVPGVIIPQQHPQLLQQRLLDSPSLNTPASLDSAASLSSTTSLDVLFDPSDSIQTASPWCNSSLLIKRCSCDEQVADQLPAAATAAVRKQLSGLLQRGKQLLTRLSSSDSAVSPSSGALRDSAGPPAPSSGALVHSTAAPPDSLRQAAGLQSGAGVDSAAGLDDTHGPAGSINPWCNRSLLIKRVRYGKQPQDQLPAAAAAARKQLFGVLQLGKMLFGKHSRRSRHSSYSSGESDGSAAAGSLKAATSAALQVHVQVLEQENPCAVSVPGFCGLRWFRKEKNAS